jgi:DNA-binding GntR family transcriptional regulator
MADKIVDNLEEGVTAPGSASSIPPTAPASAPPIAPPTPAARRTKARSARDIEVATHLRVTAQLRAGIVNGRFQPNERLVEADLTEALGAGRSAVRTALARLEQEGLVEHERNRGARVRLVDEPEAVEILEARAVLEGLAARRAALNASPREIAALRQILYRMRTLLDRDDLLAASNENAALHRRLLEIAGHRTATRLISSLKSQLVRFQYRTILLPGRSERSFAEHRAIVDAVAAGDPDAAEAAMRTHLSHVADALRSATR